MTRPEISVTRPPGVAISVRVAPPPSVGVALPGRAEIDAIAQPMPAVDVTGGYPPGRQGPPGPPGPPGPGDLAGIQGSLHDPTDLPAQGSHIGEAWITGPLGQLWVWR